MTSHHLIDPELLGLLDILGPSTPSDLSLETLPMARESLMGVTPKVSLSTECSPVGIEALCEASAPPTDGVLVTQHAVPASAGAPDIRVLMYQPALRTSRRAAILHIHGGGYVAGTPELNDEQSRAWATELGVVVVSVDYRLAPETKAPGPLEDCYDSLLWMHASASQLGIDPPRIAVAGESAGGGLAAALALLARDRAEVPLAFQLLMYPMLDDRTVVNPPSPFQGEFLWTPRHNLFGWTSLLGSEPGSANVSCYSAAARAEELGGLPPAFIAVGALDLFCSESINYARRLIEAGVPAELHVYPGAFHGFDAWPSARVTQALNTARTAALRRALCEIPAV